MGFVALGWGMVAGAGYYREGVALSVVQVPGVRMELMSYLRLKVVLLDFAELMKKGMGWPSVVWPDELQQLA